jgi:hypothetical protein
MITYEITTTKQTYTITQVKHFNQLLETVYQNELVLLVIAKQQLSDEVIFIHTDLIGVL